MARLVVRALVVEERSGRRPMLASGAVGTTWRTRLPSLLALALFLVTTLPYGGVQASEAQREPPEAQPACRGVTDAPAQWRERGASLPEGEQDAVEPCEREEPLDLTPRLLTAAAVLVAVRAPDDAPPGRCVAAVRRTRAHVALALARGPPRS